MRLLRRWPSTLLVLALATTGLIGVGRPASAESVCPNLWANQQVMADEPAPACRATWLVDPGRGNFLTRADLLRAHQLYEAQGFTMPWLWYAPQQPVSFPGPFPQDWTSCPTLTHVNGVCATTTGLPSNILVDNFSARPVVMSVFAYQGNFVSAVCGNFGVPLQPLTAPVPVITVHKFNDLNGNGVQDSGEPPLAGWTFQLIRQSSLFGDQGPGLADTQVTDGNGDLTFRLGADDAGPGTYLVQEVSQDDWVMTTTASPPIVVRDGIGDGPVANLTVGNTFQAITAAGTTIAPTEGVAFTGTVATFTDPDPAGTPAEYSATIDWGDGTPISDGAISKTPEGTFTITGSHTYTDEGAATATVTIHDIDNPANTATAATTVTVGDAPLSADTPTSITAVEGAGFTATVGSFTDANPGSTITDFTASIDWGDGTSSSGGTVSGPTGGPFTVTGTHTYTEEGSYPLTVSVLDDGGATTTLTGAATVTDAALTATGNPNLLSTNPVTNLPVATFTDANPGGTIADFTASIDWGDGATSAGTVSGPTGGPFTVTGTHTYATLGPKTITVYIVDDGGATATAFSHLILFAYPAGGNFVIGNATTAPGIQVNFWGSQWAKNNPLTGDSPPNAFKGFEDNPELPVCGGTWTSRPGNSSNPPDTIPTYMAVIVSTHVEQNGSTITGDIQHVLIVATDPGYAGNPGHDGTGTIVAILC